MKEELEKIIKDHCDTHDCCLMDDKTKMVDEILSLITDSDGGAEVTLDCVVKILATELAETWWTAVYFERDNMSSFDAEKAGEVKATTEYEHFIPQAEKLLERIKF